MNATFCLLSSRDIVGFAAGSCALSPSQRLREFQLLQYPDTLALWSEALRGRIDFAQLRRRAESLPSSLADLGNDDQGGKVFYHRGDLVVGDALEWQHGALPRGSGARTILVEGDITFNNSSSYGAALGAADSVRRLASVAWIAMDNPATPAVEGNITIDPAVTDLAGAFLASGRINTGTGTNPLTVQGLMVAKQFAFQRQYADQARGAELIIYDGRALLNPPPGLGDIVKALPTFRSVASP